MCTKAVGQNRALTGWRVSRHTHSGKARGGQHCVTSDASDQVDPCPQHPPKLGAECELFDFGVY